MRRATSQGLERCQVAGLTLPQSKKATEADLRREFEMYGAIERVRIVRDRKGRSNSYAFIVYERERDMKGESLILLHVSPLTSHSRIQRR